MSLGSPVAKQIILTPERLRQFPQLSDAAIDRAIMAAIPKIEAIGKKFTPVDTGRLEASIIVASSPKTIVMIWSAKEPKTGFDYAKVVEVGRTGIRAFAGRFYAESTKGEALVILLDELAREFAAL